MASSLKVKTAHDLSMKIKTLNSQGQGCLVMEEKKERRKGIKKGRKGRKEGRKEEIEGGKGKLVI